MTNEVEQGPEGSTEAVERPSSPWRNIWQLHVPLAVVLVLCTVVTIIEVRRASEGVWRAWAYMFEWPLIGLFTIWIWHRYRTEGSLTKGMVARWRERIGRLEAEAEAEPEASRVSGHDIEASPGADVSDPELQAWRTHIADLQRREPPGEPPFR